MRQGGDSLIKTSVAPVYGASPIIDPLAEGGGVSGFELKKTNELMANLTKKMKRHESRLKNKLSETTSVSSSSNSTPKRTSTRKDVPCEVSKLP